LCHDPALKLLASTRSRDTNVPTALAGKSTLNRLEQSWEIGDRRYHAFTPNLKKLSGLLVALFLESRDRPPEQITLDIDATDIEVHGHQDNSLFMAITSTVVFCHSMSSVAATYCWRNCAPPISMAPAVRGTSSGASSR
jgi:hypothetical protein